MTKNLQTVDLKSKRVRIGEIEFVASEEGNFSLRFDPSRRYPPGTVLWVYEEEGDYWRKVTIQTEGEPMIDECSGCECQGEGRISVQCMVVEDSDLHFLRSEAELAEHYAPGAVVLVSEDEGMTYRKVVVPVPAKKELTGELTLNDLEAAISKFKHEYDREPSLLVVSQELEARGRVLCNVTRTYHKVGADRVRHDLGLRVWPSLAPEQWFVTDDDLMSERISAKERLPEPNVPVLVWYKGIDADPFVGIGKWYPERHRFWAVTAYADEWFWTGERTILYWQPLPSL